MAHQASWQTRSGGAALLGRSTISLDSLPPTAWRHAVAADGQPPGQQQPTTQLVVSLASPKRGGELFLFSSTRDSPATWQFRYHISGNPPKACLLSKSCRVRLRTPHGEGGNLVFMCVNPLAGQNQPLSRASSHPVPLTTQCLVGANATSRSFRTPAATTPPVQFSYPVHLVNLALMKIGLTSRLSGCGFGQQNNQYQVPVRPVSTAPGHFLETSI
ncbi:hypothetical protein B0T11DRAFT_143708 [Plectosphaerella cucumerina]|uniref:Uncharacterized protein n=1 Tax=Plectosphaerella cucumerina TaxID=40658 RepID=A0A8K0WZA0_9PEZI|nr:hypothetical protein B0T11DRAFT_143708 [Plectosphaerella cucumerina]